jgi:ATPase family associated with various cellular activities (AAA)
VSGPAALDWLDANQRYIAAELARLMLRLTGGSEDALAAAQGAVADAGSRMPAPAAIDIVARTFGLSGFERDLLLLTAGIEMNSQLAQACAAIRDHGGGVTFGLALALLDEGHWSALTPARPLRRWRLLELEGGGALTRSPLRIDERILHFLAGINLLDSRLQPVFKQRPEPELIANAHEELAQQLHASWSGGSMHLPLQLIGDDAAGAEDIAATLAARSGQQLLLVRAEDLPTLPQELELFATLVERELALLPALLLVRIDSSASHTTSTPMVLSLADRLASPLIIAARDPLQLRRANDVRDVQKPAVPEQRRLWRQALALDTERDDAIVAAFDAALQTVASQFRLSAQTIGTAANNVRKRVDEGESPGRALWSVCRTTGRSRLDELAQYIRASAGWDDLVLPPSALTTLHEIAAHVRARGLVYEEWGFAKQGGRGLGISALFVGESGTGKTLAAEVLAAELNLDLYRIDLASVVSKYIGETEKNLRRVFDAAEDSGAILLFDEADALFGKRSEVKDSHDRYANIEISYLLQRMEAYRGLAILTTNLKDALDAAFLRRLRFVVPFPFPDAVQRTEIWRRVFPPPTPTQGLDVAKLARLNVTGGNIRNIALYAAFLAAGAGEPVSMAHLLRAARVEYAKLERPLTEAEIGGWQ